MPWLTTLAAAAGAVVALAAALAILWKVAKPHVVDLIEQVTAAKDDAHKAAAQLQPNGGRSVSDRVDAIAARQGELVHDVELQGVRVEGIERGFYWAGRALDQLVVDVDNLQRQVRGYHDEESTAEGH